jgi:hypothetical protein
VEAAAKSAKEWTDSQRKELFELTNRYAEQNERVKALGAPVEKAIADGRKQVEIGMGNAYLIKNRLGQ